MKFEYKIVDCQFTTSESELNKLGLHGWEIVSAMSINPTFLRYVLKRQISGDEFMAGV